MTKQRERPVSGSIKRPAAFFDRDGVINVDCGYLHKPSDFKLVEGAAEAIRFCNQAGFLVFVVTNQGGVGLGLYDEAAVDVLHQHMRDVLAAQGAYIDDIRHCPHHPEAVQAHYRAPCSWRKPGPGMILDLMHHWPVDAASSFLVGDQDRDVEAARAAEISGTLYGGGDLLPLVRELIASSNAKRVREWLIQYALPYWSDAGVDLRGDFAERLTLDGILDHAAPRRLMTQMRQIYVYAHAAVLGLSPDGAALARQAFDQALARAALSGGGFAYSLAPDGGVADDMRDTYTHAFILLAASWLYRATGDRRVLAQIDKTADAIEALRHPGGLGYVESDRPGPLRRQNPHMHLFEAFLAAHAATGEAVYLARAGEIRELFFRFFFDPSRGVVREYYDQNFAPAPGMQGTIVEGGHMYEWVWLLGEYAKAAGEAMPPEALALYNFSANHAHEPDTGLIYHENSVDGAVHHEGKRAWPLTEAIKAAIARAESEMTPLDPVADRSVRLLFEYFLNRPRPGAWLDTLTAENVPAVKTSAASNFYHVFLAFAEYIRFQRKN